MTNEPSVSVILPTLNERGFIRDCLDTLAGQDYANLGEVLVVDGGSTDGTREIASLVGGPVRVVDNPRTTAAAALNIGLAESKGDVIVRADAHTVYDPTYVRRCVEVLQDSLADNVGGAMRPVGTTRFGQAVAAVTSSPFGVGPGKFHYSGVREEVDTVYLGCWRRETLEELGGWDDTHLQWGAEDHELNLRLRDAGGVIVLDPSIRSSYFPRETPRSLWRQYRNYGMGKASTLAKHRTLPTWRPLAPAALVAATAVLGVRSRRAAAIVPLVHLGLAGALALRLARRPGVDAARAVAAVEICHWAYGIGFWQGVARVVSGRSFDSRPRGHR
jgi:glycosyltransferase involved in cell wall biosynthesis